MSQRLGIIVIGTVSAVLAVAMVIFALAGLTGVLPTLAGLVSDSLRVEEPDLYGLYVAEYKNGSERLTLQRDGTYVQEIALEGSDVPTINSGVWRHYRPKDSIVDRVDFENCLGVGDGFGRIRPDFASRRGGCSFGVGRRWVFLGQLRLGPDEASPLWKVS